MEFSNLTLNTDLGDEFWTPSNCRTTQSLRTIYMADEQKHALGSLHGIRARHCFSLQSSRTPKYRTWCTLIFHIYFNYSFQHVLAWPEWRHSKGLTQYFWLGVQGHLRYCWVKPSTWNWDIIQGLNIVLFSRLLRLDLQSIHARSC